MHQSFSFGRILGVKVGANWSVIVILWLIAEPADERFPVVAPGYSTTSYWISGVLAAVTFFMCLLAHELAHSVVARRYDVHLEGIVLWLFGGVSKFTGDPPSAQAELKIAAAGPATSMGIAVGFFALTRLVDGVGGSALAGAALGWLGWFNGSLAVFNLVPAFPLDGGRVLRVAVGSPWGQAPCHGQCRERREALCLRADRAGAPAVPHRRVRRWALVCVPWVVPVVGRSGGGLAVHA